MIYFCRLADEGESTRRWSERDERLRRKMESVPVECCPTIEETVAPEGGKRRDGMYVELYKDGDVRQELIEVSCKPEVVGRPCQYINRRMYNNSRCVQRYSYTYAIVRNVSREDSAKDSINLPLSRGSAWVLDHIRVRSGCSCEVDPKPGKRSSSKSRKRKNKRNKD